jgi:hypothetical protein
MINNDIKYFKTMTTEFNSNNNNNSNSNNNNREPIRESMSSARASLLTYIRSHQREERTTEVQIMDGEEFIPLPHFDEDDDNQSTITTESMTSIDEEECHRIICCESFKCSQRECSICLEDVQTGANSSTTRCGHTFHTSCFLKAIHRGPGNCPNCRALLVIKNNQDDDEEYEEDEEYESQGDESQGDESQGDDDDYDDDDDDDYDDYEEGEEDESQGDEEFRSRVNLDQLANKMQNMGYSYADLLGFYIDNKIVPSTSSRHNIDFFMKLGDDLHGIIDGTIPLSQKDNRSYRDVV